MTTKELLEKYNKVTKDADNERALWNLLKANEEHITGLIEEDPSGYWFHKAHRQTDVCPDGYTDMAIWMLLGEATLFWEMLESEKKISKYKIKVCDFSDICVRYQENICHTNCEDYTHK